MNVLKNLWAKAGGRSDTANAARRMGVWLLVVVIAFTVVWFIAAAGSEKMVAVFPSSVDRLSGDDLSTAVEMLRSRGIDCRADNGRILVGAQFATQGRDVLVEAGFGGDKIAQGDQFSNFSKFAAAGDIWATQAQSDKRWQAAKMATLSRLVGNFPSVSSAVVIFEPARRAGLGRVGTKPTAAVNVHLKPSARMTGQLVAAIADLVAGSIRGMKREEVCVVDGCGRSYRVDDSLLAEEQAIAQKRATEDYYENKISSALAYIRALTVSVEADASKAGKCKSVRLAVPRSYFQTDADIKSQSAQIRQIVGGIIGLAATKNIIVDCYRDTPAPPAVASDSDTSAWTPWLIGGSITAIVFGWVLCCLALVRSVRRTRRRVEIPPAVAMATVSGLLDSAESSPSPGAFMFEDIVDAPPDRLRTALCPMEPQTIAVSLLSAESELAAKVFRSLPYLRARRVRRQIKQMGPVRLTDVQSAQQYVATAVRQCASVQTNHKEARL